MTKQEIEEIKQAKFYFRFGVVALLLICFFISLDYIVDGKTAITNLQQENELLIESIRLTNGYIDDLEQRFDNNETVLQAFKDMYERDLQKQEEYNNSISRESISLEIEAIVKKYKED